MDIFEQYGIKEVADCTLYSIALDKYDNEIYIPVLYFDTLKLSSIEQSASTTSAKGGKGNSELITWNFGKEITVNLRDALCTPASLSLLWGGKFGSKNTEINGFWNPIHKKRYEQKEIMVYENKQNEQNIKTLKKFYRQVKEYEEVVNNIYNIIQSAENFLHPYILVSIFNSQNSQLYNRVQLSPSEIYNATHTYVPTGENQEDALFRGALDKIIKEKWRTPVKILITGEIVDSSDFSEYPVEEGDLIICKPRYSWAVSPDDPMYYRVREIYQDGSKKKSRPYATADVVIDEQDYKNASENELNIYKDNYLVFVKKNKNNYQLINEILNLNYSLQPSLGSTHPKYYNDIIGIFDKYRIGRKVISVRYPPPPLKTYTVEELLEQIENGSSSLEWLLDLFAGLYQSKTVELNAWKKLSNKNVYDLKTLIKICSPILYNYTNKTTNYTLPENMIDILIENFEVEKIDGQLKLTFLTSVKDQSWQEHQGYILTEYYTYTSEYLGQNLKDIQYPYILNINEEPVSYNCNLFLPRAQKIGQPAERAKIILKNFGDFNMTTRKKGVQYNSRTVLHEIGVNGSINFNNQEQDTYYEYEWKDCEINMISLEGQGDTYFANHIDILYRFNSANYEQKLLIKRNNDESYYNSQIDFYEERTINGQATKFKIGTFYINDSFNNAQLSESTFYPIAKGAKELFYLDRLEKHKAEKTFCINVDKNFSSNIKKDLPLYKKAKISVYIDPKTMKPFQSNARSFVKQNGTVVYGNLRIIKKDQVYYLWKRDVADKYKSIGNEIIVTERDFPGTYKLVANTQTRSRTDGKDSKIQIEIPLCTVMPETNLELTADGEPATFDIQLKVLKNKTNEMIKIQKFDIMSDEEYNIKQKTYFENSINDCEICDTPKISFTKETDILDMQIVLPQDGDYYCFAIDCLPPFNGIESYLAFPKTNKIAAEIYEVYKNYQTLIKQEAPEDVEERESYNEQVSALKRQLEEYRNILLVKVPLTDTIIYIGKTPYLIAINGSYEFYQNTEEMTEEIGNDKKVYRIAFITQENIKRFSPIEFTLIGGNNS